MRGYRVAWLIWAVTAGMLWPVGQATAQQPDGASSAAVGPGPGAAVGEKAEQDCHGPLYYRLQRDAEEQRARERSALEMAGFIEQVTPIILEANRAYLAAVPERLLPDYRRCLAATRKPSFLCQALAGNDPTLCDRLPTPERQEPCRALAFTARAVRGGQTAICQEIGEPDLMKLCGFLVSGSARCEELSRDEVRGVCRSWQAARGGSVGALPPETAGPVNWLLALSTGQGEACDRLPEPEEAVACRGWIARDFGVCPLERPLDEAVDRDYSCRRLVVDSRQHPTDQGLELALLLASPYDGQASCELLLDLERDGARVTRTADRFEVPGDSFWKSYLLPLGDHRLLAVRTDCRWRADSGAR